MITITITNLESYKIMLTIWSNNIETNKVKIKGLIHLLKSKVINEFYLCDDIMETNLCLSRDLLKYMGCHTLSSDVLSEYNCIRYEYIILNNKWRLLLRNCVVHGHDFNKWHLKENFNNK